MMNQLLAKLSPSRSMRARISIVMGLLWLVFGIVLTLFMEMRFESSLRSAAENSLNATADEIAHTLVKDLQDRQRELALLADLLGASQIIHPSSATDVINGLKTRQPIYAWIGIADATGRITSGSDGLLLGADVSARPWFKEGIRGEFVSDPHDAKLLERHFKRTIADEPVRFVDVAIPIFGERQEVKAVLSAHLFWHWVNEVVSSTLAKRREKTPVEVLIANRDGEWLLKLHVDQTAQVKQFAQAIGDDNYLIATQTVATSIPKDGLAWTVIVREHKRTALALVEESRQMLLAASAFIAMIFAFVAWMVSGRIAKPLIRLADIARDYAASRSNTFRNPHGKMIQDETSVLDAAMDQLAHYDRLTGLCNRAEFLISLHAAIDTTKNTQSYYSLILINLDNFGVINSTRGHDIGDQLLIAVAKRLQHLEDKYTVISRLGGDEFIVLTEHPDTNLQHAEVAVNQIVQRIMKKFNTPFTLSSGEYLCPASLGTTMIGDAEMTPDDALKFTELAVAEAKRRGKHQWVKFESCLLERLFEREQFKEDFFAAIPSQLRVFYQAQVNHRGELVGAEALVRWLHPERGLISPALFIPLAEETGMIIPVGLWVMKTACLQLKQWENDPKREHLTIAVNVSSQEFNEAAYVRQVEDILIETGIRPHKLKLELTESALASDVEAVVEKMRLLKDFGLRFSLDDFGTGFSSLSYLRRMPLNQLKIDQSFIRDVTQNTSDASIVKTVIALGKGLGLSVIAEGVETAEQEQLLSEFGCDLYQGYFFGRPQPIEEFECAAEQRQVALD